MKRLLRAWKQDRLGVAGVGCAIGGVVYWALMPEIYEHCNNWSGIDYGVVNLNIGCINIQLFNSWNLPAILYGFGLGAFLLLLRRR